jgi:hypothetical protein
LATELESDFKYLTENKRKVASFRDTVATHLRNYTCSDSSLETSAPVAHYTYTPSGGQPLEVKVYLDRPHSKIWAIDGFVSEEECKILMDHGRPKLLRATVAAEDGSSVVSEHRKAQQASYDFHGEDDPLRCVAARCSSSPFLANGCM